MTSAIDEVTELIQRSDALPWSQECGKLLETAIALAESAELDQYAYAARARQVCNACAMDDDELLLASFTILESQHRENPNRFPLNARDMGLPGLTMDVTNLLWMWKWIPGTLKHNPAFTAAMIEQTLQQMEDAYRREGAPLKAVSQARLSWAVLRGDAAEVRRLLDVVAVMPEDEWSHCVACSRAQIIEAALELNDDERALQLLDEQLAKGDACNAEPTSVFSLSFDLLAKHGQVETLNHIIEVILVRASNDPVHTIRPLARLALFLVSCGEIRRAFILLRRLLPLVAEDSFDADVHLTVLGLLQRVAEGTQMLATDNDQGKPLRETVLSETAHPAFTRYFGGRALTLAEAAKVSQAALNDLLQRFSERDANTSGAHRSLRTRERSTHAPGALAGLGVKLPADAQFAFAENPDTQPMRLDDAPRVVPTSSEDAADAASAYVEWGREEDALALVRDWLPRTEMPTTRAALLKAGSAAAAALGHPDEAAELAAAHAAATAAAEDEEHPSCAEQIGSARTDNTPTASEQNSVTSAEPTDAQVAAETYEAVYRATLVQHERVQRYGDATARAGSAIKLLDAAVDAKKLSEALALADYLERLAPQLPKELLSGLHDARASAYLQPNRFHDMLRAAQQAHKHLVDVEPAGHLEEATVLLRQAQALSLLGRNVLAASLALRAAEMFDATDDKLSATAAVSLAAVSKARSGDPAIGGQLAEMVMTALEQIEAQVHPVSQDALRQELARGPQRGRVIRQRTSWDHRQDRVSARAVGLTALYEAAAALFPESEAAGRILDELAASPARFEQLGDPDTAQKLRAYIEGCRVKRGEQEPASPTPPDTPKTPADESPAGHPESEPRPE